MWVFKISSQWTLPVQMDETTCRTPDASYVYNKARWRCNGCPTVTLSTEVIFYCLFSLLTWSYLKNYSNWVLLKNFFRVYFPTYKVSVWWHRKYEDTACVQTTIKLKLWWVGGGLILPKQSSISKFKLRSTPKSCTMQVGNCTIQWLLASSIQFHSWLLNMN